MQKDKSLENQFIGTYSLFACAILENQIYQFGSLLNILTEFRRILLLG